MKKSNNVFTEHCLVPAVLFLLNICLVHTIYAFASASSYSPGNKLAVTAAFVLLIGALVVKKQVVLGGSILFYVVVVLWI